MKVVSRKRRQIVDWSKVMPMAWPRSRKYLSDLLVSQTFSSKIYFSTLCSYMMKKKKLFNIKPIWWSQMYKQNFLFTSLLIAITANEIIWSFNKVKQMLLLKPLLIRKKASPYILKYLYIYLEEEKSWVWSDCATHGEKKNGMELSAIRKLNIICF